MQTRCWAAECRRGRGLGERSAAGATAVARSTRAGKPSSRQPEGARARGLRDRVSGGKVGGGRSILGSIVAEEAAGKKRALNGISIIANDKGRYGYSAS